MSLRIRARRKNGSPQQRWRKFLLLLEKSLDHRKYPISPLPSLIDRIAARIMRFGVSRQGAFSEYKNSVGEFHYPVAKARSLSDRFLYALLESGEIIWCSPDWTEWNTHLAPEMNRMLKLAITKGIWPEKKP